MTFKPTDEQVAIVDTCATGGNLVIDAAAGSGKTSTLKLIAAAAGRRRGLYLAYNRAIKDDAAKSFASTVRCMTSHGLAYQPMATRYRHRLGGARIPAQQAAQILRINDPVRLAPDLAPLGPQQLARIATATVARFCMSADEQPNAGNVPHINGLEDGAVRAELVAAIVPIAGKVWADIQDPGGRLRFEHDHYLKMFQLTRPQLSVDYLLVDEAQDLNPLVQAIVGYQTDAQVILVGDRCQQLYAWRGAVDAMSTFVGPRLALTQSFRFGHEIAEEANKWLTLCRADIRVRGFDPVPSVVEPIAAPRAILCRTNGAAIGRVISSLNAGRRTALVGGGGDLARMARAAADLMSGRPTDHPELLAFGSWREVQDYVAMDSAGADLAVFVKLIDDHGPDALIAVTNRLVDETRADTIVSTAHRSKGREWDTVAIAGDFREPKPNEDGSRGDVTREDAMLAYVAVTRAKLGLDREGLTWVDEYLPRAIVPAQHRIADLLDESSLGTPEAVRADWESDERPVEPHPHCRRCGSPWNRCPCDPVARRRFYELAQISVGA